MPTYGPDRLLACPACNHVSLAPHLLSDSSLRGRVATWWSDGFVAKDDPKPNITMGRCSGCHGFFWVQEATLLAHRDQSGQFFRRPRQAPSTGGLLYQPIDVAAVPARWHEAMPFPELTVQDWRRAVIQRAWRDEAQERDARLKYLWAAGDAVRALHVTPGKPDVDACEATMREIAADPAWQDNVDAILASLEGARELPQVIQRAEMLRERGRFDESRGWCARVPADSQASWIARGIEERAARGLRQIFSN